MFEGHTGHISGLFFSHDGKIVVSGSRDCNVLVWDVSTGKQLAILQGHEKDVEAVCLSSDERLIASCSQTTLRLWDAQAHKELLSIADTRTRVTSVFFLPSCWV